MTEEEKKKDLYETVFSSIKWMADNLPEDFSGEIPERTDGIVSLLEILKKSKHSKEHLQGAINVCKYVESKLPECLFKDYVTGYKREFQRRLEEKKEKEKESEKSLGVQSNAWDN